MADNIVALGCMKYMDGFIPITKLCMAKIHGPMQLLYTLCILPTYYLMSLSFSDFNPSSYRH